MGRKLYLLTDEECRDIKMWIWKGVRYARIAAQFNLSKGYISQISTGATKGEIEWPDGSLGRLSRHRALEIEKDRKISPTHVVELERDLPTPDGGMTREERDKFRAEYEKVEMDLQTASDEELRAILQPKKGKARGKKGG
jgi:hypothetical protein|tara:strand:+ start:52 stop:471 length:420 start_codon:yes stop_codon:yes gene_type:complete